MGTTRIQKWGNSYGLRIPKIILDELAIQPGNQVEVHHENGRIVVTPIRAQKINLDKLLDQITSENLHHEVDWGDTLGEEVW